MSDPKIEKAVSDAKAEIEKEIDEFKAALDAGTSDPSSFMTLAEIEKRWKELNSSTSKTYSDLVAAYLSTMDERPVIRSKKENTPKEG